MAARERKQPGPSLDGTPLPVTAPRATHEPERDEGRQAALDPTRRISLGPSAWFFAVDPLDAAARPARRPHVFAVALFVLALVAVAVARGVVLRALLPVALVAGAIVVLMRGRRRPPRPRARRAVELSDDGLYFHTRAPVASPGAAAAPTLLVSTRAPFGLTLVTTRRRDRVVAALSSSLGTYYLGATFDADDRKSHAALLAAASIVSSDEAGLEAVGPDGEPIELEPGDFRALADALGTVDASCAQRFILSDARGAPVTLDGPDLRIQQHRFDLSAPLEWRAIVFQEAFGQAVAIYQGTWVRQGPAELVLISLLPSIAPLGPVTEADRTGLPELDRAILRDLRLLQATPEEAPPRDQRVAIDRLFMLPLRNALDRAPRTGARTRATA